MDTAPPTAGQDDGAHAIAGRAVARWQEIAVRLSPILGQRGVAALYRRTLTLAARDHPCLQQAHEPSEPLRFDHLRAALLPLPAGDAAAAFEASITTFQALLNSLIGPSLTHRLLHGPAPSTATEPRSQDQAT